MADNNVNPDQDAAHLGDHRPVGADDTDNSSQECHPGSSNDTVATTSTAADAIGLQQEEASEQGDSPSEEELQELFEEDSDAHDQEEMELEENHEENGDLMRVLTYLLYSSAGGSTLTAGQQLRAVLRNYPESSEDSDDSDYPVRRARLPFARQFRHRTPKPPDNPDTSVIDKSELRQEMLYRAGKLHPLRKMIQNSRNYTTHHLIAKETGIYSSRQQMSHGDRVTAASPYLPDVAKNEPLEHLQEKLFCGIHSKNGDLFMSACQDARIRIYDTTKGGFEKIKTVHARDVGWSILDIDFSHDGNHLIYSSWSEYIHFCNIRGESEVHEALFIAPSETHRSAIFTLRFSPDDSEIIAGANSGWIYVYDRERTACTLKIEAHEDDISSICFADIDSNIIFSGGDDGVVKAWDRRTLRETDPRPVGSLAGHYDSITHLDSRNDGRYVISNSKDQSIKLWDIRKFSPRAGIDATRRAVANQHWDYRMQPYPGRIVKAKLEGDSSLMTYHGHSVLRTLIRARFSPQHNTGQRYIYTGCGLGRVVVYDILTGKTVLELKADKCGDVIRDVSWHPYNNEIISSGWDGRLLQWEKRPKRYTGVDIY